MGLIDKIAASRTEARVIGGVPWRPWDSPYWLPWKFSQGGPVHPSRAYYGVDRALGLPALYACTRLLAESIASLEASVYQGEVLVSKSSGTFTIFRRKTDAGLAGPPVTG